VYYPKVVSFVMHHYHTTLTRNFFLGACGRNNKSISSFSPLTIPVKKWWLLCIVKQNDKPKTTTTMKLNYTIDCRHCGTHTEYSIVRHYRTMSDAEAAGKMHIDTECAMRCPACRYRLNTTEADFRSQVHITREA
jgi:hypothetical protein